MNSREIEQIEAMKAEQRRIVNQMSESKQAMPSAGCDMAARERTAREVIAEICMSKQVAAEELNELLKALPQELPWRADRALRRLIQK